MFPGPLQDFGLEVGNHLGDYILTKINKEGLNYVLYFGPAFGSDSESSSLIPALYEAIYEVETDKCVQSLKLIEEPYLEDCYLVQKVAIDVIMYNHSHKGSCCI